jgi:hypothetical protein
VNDLLRFLELIGILTVVFGPIILALYYLGKRVAAREAIERKRREEAEKQYWLMQAEIDRIIQVGTPEEKLQLLLWMQSQQLRNQEAYNAQMQQLRALVGLDVLLNL